MDPITIGLIGGTLLSGLKGAVDSAQYGRNLQLAADTQRYSPWTGLRADVPNMPNAVGTIMQGATAGAMLGQGLAKGAADISKLKGENTLSMAPTSPQVEIGKSTDLNLTSPFGTMGMNSTQSPWRLLMNKKDMENYGIG